MAGEPPFTFLRELPLARDAWAYAEQLHAEQRRESDEAPFILHPLEVASLLRNTGHREAVVAAGILHDTVEDTDASTEDIRARFGDEVAALVAAMTEDESIEPYEARKAALRKQNADFGDGATAVYAADKVAKLRELRARVTLDPTVLETEREQRRLDHYRQSLAMLEHGAAEHPLVRQLRFELEALQALPPHAD
jgi:(p)ppGpp synthase/HD superfamily hydrolase